MTKDHEYSPIEKLDLQASKKLLKIPGVSEIFSSSDNKFISFFAEWCPDCDHEANNLKEYHSLFKSHLDFFLIMLFSTNEMNLIFKNKYGLEMNTIQGELDVKNERLNTQTQFFNFRTNVNDDRKWGVPLHIIKLNINEIYIIKGESLNEEVVSLVQKTL